MRRLYLVMIIVSVILLIGQLFFLDYSHLFGWRNLVKILPPPLMIIVFYNGYLIAKKEKR
ncbi:MAG: hypothetical protein KDC81_07915 [Flavobacteriaceae bacterium]|nr:hypothetical protein [Flavobacteriaceae bacterium]